MNAKSTNTSRPTFRSASLAAVIAALAFGASAPCFAFGSPVAGAGEAQDLALPNVRIVTSQANEPGTLTSADSSGASSINSVLAQANTPITRDRVRSELAAARANGSINVAGEIGDNSRTVLAARDHANDEQADAIVAEYRAEYDRTVALQEAERLRASIELAGVLDAALASAGDGDEAYMPSGSGDEPVDVSAVRIDVIRMEPEVVQPENELIVVSMPAGDEAAQLERAAAIRRQLGEMGLSQDQVYIEAAPESE